jgi:hypothetical protein
VTSAAADDHLPVEHVVSLRRERLYGAIPGIATLTVLFRYTDGDTSAYARATGGVVLGVKILAH